MAQNQRDHVPGPGGTLCGSRSVAAICRVADCTRCQKRLEEIMELLLQVAEGKEGATRRVQNFVARMEWMRADTKE